MDKPTCACESVPDGFVRAAIICFGRQGLLAQHVH
jgi:hypothetical protein